MKIKLKNHMWTLDNNQASVAADVIGSSFERVFDQSVASVLEAVSGNFECCQDKSCVASSPCRSCFKAHIALDLIENRGVEMPEKMDGSDYDKAIEWGQEAVLSICDMVWEAVFQIDYSLFVICSAEDVFSLITRAHGTSYRWSTDGLGGTVDIRIKP